MSHSAVTPESFSKLNGYEAIRPWLVCIVASFFFMYQFAQVNMFNALGPAMIEAFKIDALQLGNLSAMSIYANVLLLPVAGLILDRYSARNIILLGMLVCVAFTGLFSYAETYALAAFARFVAGLSGAFCFLGCIVLASRWLPSSQMAKATGLIVTMAMIGGALAQEPMAIMIDTYGWQLAVRGYALLGCVFFVMMYAVIADSPTEKVHHPASQISWASLKESARAASGNLQNWLCGAYTSSMNLIILVIGAVWGCGYLQAVHGIPHLAATRITSLIFIGTMIGSPFIGWFSDRLALRRLPMLLGAWLSLFIVLIVILVPGQTFMTLSVLFFLLGVTSSSQVVGYPVIAESNSPKHIGLCESLASFMIMGSGAVCQDIFALLMNFHAVGKFHAIGTVHYHPADYEFAFWLLPFGFMLSLVFAYCVRETYAKPYQGA